MLKKIIYFLIGLIERYEYRNISLDENDINKKILNTISNLDLIVKTDTGYEKVTDIHLTQPYKVYEIVLDNGYKLECADNHILFDKSFNQVFCQDLNTNSSYIQTDKGLSKVIKINKFNQKLSMFDSTINHRNHRFYTNGILSHNTVNAAIAMLHFITFNNDKNIMIVANIRGTTIEIIDKIKNIYVQLPFFLKTGIKNWNQQSMIFENGCRIKSSARSKTPAIGFTIDFLYLDEFAHIPSNIIEPYYTAAFPTVSAIENSKIVITSTPNGMNLFYRLLTDAERPEGDPLKNNYKAMRVYWYQVPGRFVTYYRLNNHRLYENNLTKEEVYQQVKDYFGELTKVEMKFIPDLTKDVIYIYNNEFCSDGDVKKFILKKEDRETSIHSVAEVTTWKEEAIKDIGGEDAFNQEYGLRFINATRSLLNESIIENLLNGKKNYIYRTIDEFDRKLKFSYSDLKWVFDPDIFLHEQRKNIKGIISVDISEGLGQDYSVINIFKIREKPEDLIELQKFKYTNMSDFFCLEQIGIYRCNHVSVKQLAEIFYLLAFEYFDYENFKVVLELNNYGNEFLAHLPNVFDGSNDYGSNIFFRYKHRVDALDEKIGLKVGENKNILVKDYQEAMEKKSFILNNEDNIREITTFVKHITSAGNVRYASDIGHDDTVMTLVNASSIFTKHPFKEICEDLAENVVSKSTLAYWKNILSQIDYTGVADYSSIIKINRQRRLLNQMKNTGNTNNIYGTNLSISSGRNL
jgi:hypothetical protein